MFAEQTQQTSHLGRFAAEGAASGEVPNRSSRRSRLRNPFIMNSPRSCGYDVTFVVNILEQIILATEGSEDTEKTDRVVHDLLATRPWAISIPGPVLQKNSLYCTANVLIFRFLRRF